MLVVIGLSINKHWGDHWGYSIPISLFLFSIREVLKFGKDEEKTKDAHPTTSHSHEANIGNTHLMDIEYDEDDIDSIVERGRD